MSKMIGLIDQPSFPLMSSITSNTSEKHELLPHQSKEDCGCFCLLGGRYFLGHKKSLQKRIETFNHNNKPKFVFLSSTLKQASVKTKTISSDRITLGLGFERIAASPLIASLDEISVIITITIFKTLIGLTDFHLKIKLFLASQGAHRMTRAQA